MAIQFKFLDRNPAKATISANQLASHRARGKEATFPCQGFASVGSLPWEVPRIRGPNLDPPK